MLTANGKRLRQDVLDWIQKNPVGQVGYAPLRWWIELAKRLADHPQMQFAWNELGKPKYNATGVHLLSMVMDAVQAASDECRRDSKSKEDAALNEVSKNIKSLRSAIRDAPFLNYSVAIQNDGIAALFLWRGTGSKLANRLPLQKINLDELLKFAADEIKRVDGARPARVILKTKGHAEISTFVRILASEFEKNYQSRLIATLASIVGATYSHHEALTKEQIQKILSNKKH